MFDSIFPIQIGLVHQFAPFDEALKLGEAKVDIVKEEVILRSSDAGKKKIITICFYLFDGQVYRQTVVLGLQMTSHFIILATSIAALIFL